MPKSSMLVLALASVALQTLPVLAAPAATQQEADRIKAVFERYIGHPAPGETGALALTPEGTSYRATFDYKRLMQPLESFGFSIDSASQALILTPNDNGTWHVTSDAMPPLVVHVKDQTLTLKSSTYKYDGTFDPKLGVFTDLAVSQDGTTLDQEAPTLSQHRRSGHTLLTQKSTAANGNRVDTDFHYALTDVTAQMTMRTPPPKASVAVEPTSPPMDLSYTLPSSVLDVHVDRLNVMSLLDLWAFFVAHPSREAVTAGQEELRGLLKTALPLLGGLKENGTAEALTVQSQVGEFKAAKLSGSIDAADLAGTAKIASSIAVDGLVLPNLPLPAWSVGLLPTTVDLHPSVSGLHLAEGAQEAVASFDLAHDGFTPEQSEKIGHIIWPGDGKAVLAPSHIGTPLLDLKLEGEASLGPLPAGRLTVTGTGLDKAIASLQSVVDTDESAAQVLAQLVAAKNLGKPNSDGSLVWVVEAAANGPFTVNGIPLR